VRYYSDSAAAAQKERDTLLYEKLDSGWFARLPETERNAHNERKAGYKKKAQAAVPAFLENVTGTMTAVNILFDEAQNVYTDLNTSPFSEELVRSVYYGHILRGQPPSPTTVMDTNAVKIAGAQTSNTVMAAASAQVLLRAGVVGQDSAVGDYGLIVKTYEQDPETRMHTIATGLRDTAESAIRKQELGEKTTSATLTTGDKKLTIDKTRQAIRSFYGLLARYPMLLANGPDPVVTPVTAPDGRELTARNDLRKLLNDCLGANGLPEEVYDEISTLPGASIFAIPERDMLIREGVPSNFSKSVNDPANYVTKREIIVKPDDEAGDTPLNRTLRALNEGTNDYAIWVWEYNTDNIRNAAGKVLANAAVLGTAAPTNSVGSATATNAVPMPTSVFARYLSPIGEAALRAASQPTTTLASRPTTTPTPLPWPTAEPGLQYEPLVPRKVGGTPTPQPTYTPDPRVIMLRNDPTIGID
jgi:hypothetical protein